MKKYIGFFALMALATTACTNLDEEIYSSIPKDNFFSSKEQLIVYSARAYTKLQAWGSEQSIWTLNLQLGNEIAAPKNSVNDWVDPRYYELQTHNVPASNKLNRMGWDYCFDGIAACNDVLYEVMNSSVEFDGKEMIISEMRVLRAFFYFLAVDNWANVPFSIDKGDKSTPPQKGRDFLVPFIEEEIIESLPYLMDSNDLKSYGRVTKGMANTLLAKLYLNWEVWCGTSRWADAEAACKAVMDSKLYTLATAYEDNFKVKNESSPEQIFAIPYSTVYTESDHNDFVIFIMTLPVTLCKKYNIPAAGWDGFICQPDYFKTYSEGDVRKDKTWIFGQQADASGAPIDGYIIDPDYPAENYSLGRPELNGARIGKWEYQTDGLLTSDQTSMDNDFFIFRYADVVLMYVEALVRQGRVAEAAALPEFIAIRKRAGLSPIASDDLNLDSLFIERSHELCLEGWQRQDLIRFGKYQDAWWCKPRTSDEHVILPIPKERIGTGNLTQNTGY